MELDTYRIKPTVMVKAHKIESPPVNADEAYVDEQGLTQYPPAPQELVDLGIWVGAEPTVGHDRIYEIAVRTAQGRVYARTGDWIVEDFGIYFRVLDEATFNELYEKVGV